MLQLTSTKDPENFLLSLITIIMATRGIMLMEEIVIREPTPSAQLGNFILLYSVGLKSMAVNNRIAYKKQSHLSCMCIILDLHWKNKIDCHLICLTKHFVFFIFSLSHLIFVHHKILNPGFNIFHSILNLGAMQSIKPYFKILNFEFKILQIKNIHTHFDFKSYWGWVQYIIESSLISSFIRKIIP